MPKTAEFCPMRQILFATIILTLASIFTASHVPVSTKTFFLVCKVPKSNLCTASPIQEVQSSNADRYRLVRRLRSHCGLSDLKPTTPSQKYIQVQPQEGKKILLCKVNRIFYPSKLGTQRQEIYHRGRREASPRGRYRGQTQSQYLSLNGEGKDDGKAEALSNADTSRASVSGKNGMGQAQSQSMYDPSCDECFGPSEPGADSLKRIPYGTGTPGTEYSGQKHGSGKPGAATIHTGSGPINADQHNTGGTFGPGQGVNTGPTYTPGQGSHDERYGPGQGSTGGPTFRPVQGGNGEPTYLPVSSGPTNKPGPENTGGTFRPGLGSNEGPMYTPGQGTHGARYGPGQVSAGGPTFGQGGNGEQTYTPSQGSGAPTTGQDQGNNGGTFRPGQGGNGGPTYTPSQGSSGPSYGPGQGITGGPTFGTGQGGNSGSNYTPGQGSGTPVYGPGQGSNSGPTYVPDHGSPGAPAYGSGQEIPGGLMQGPGPGNIGGPTHGPAGRGTGGPIYGLGQGNTGGPIYTPGHGSSGPVYEPSQGGNSGTTYVPGTGTPGAPTYGPGQSNTGAPTYGPEQRIDGSPMFRPGQVNTGGPTNKPNQGSTGSPTYGPDQGSTGGPKYGPGQGGTSGPTYAPGQSNLGGQTFTPGQGNADGTTYGPGTAPTYKTGQGPYNFGQTGTNGWPIISGTMPGPGGLNYYCCVVSPNNNPQYLTVQGSGENLPKNIEQALRDKLSSGGIQRPYQYPQIPYGYATGDGRSYRPEQGIVGKENTGPQGTGVGIYPENGLTGQSHNGIITQNGNLSFRPFGTGTGQGQNPMQVPYDGRGTLQKYPHDTTNVNGGYGPDFSNTRHPSDLGYASDPNFYGSNRIPDANQGQPGAENVNHLPTNTLEGQYSPFGVGQGRNEQGRPFVGNGIPQWPTTGPGGQSINKYGFQPDNKFNRNQDAVGVNNLATPQTKTIGKGTDNFGQGQFSPQTNQYGPGGHPSNQYGSDQPANQYGPGGQPAIQYGAGGQLANPHGSGVLPTNQYGPGSQPSNHYGSGGQTTNQYGPDGQQTNVYRPGSQPTATNQYGIDGKPIIQYGPGGQPLNQFSPGGKSIDQYGPGGKAPNQFGPGGKSIDQYGPGGQPTNQYGPGGPPTNQYGPGGQPTNQYGPGGQPTNQYGPGGQPTNQYGPGGQPTNQYGPGGQPTNQYGPGGQPTNQYGPGGQPTNQYGPGGQPFNQYGPGGQPTNQYGPGGQITTQFGPGGKSRDQYGLGSQPTNQYGPGGQIATQYGPSGKPKDQYGPGDQTTNQFSPMGQPTTQYGPDGQSTTQYGPDGQPTNQYPHNQQSGTGTNGYNPGTTGQRSDVSGVPHNVVDPNSIAGSLDDDSEALATVSQDVNGTVASASSKGGNDKGRAQTQVQGTYTGSGSFSAQAQISDENKGAESEVSGGKKGASSSAQGRGRNHKSQAGVQLGSETGSLQTQAQSESAAHSSNSQVQGSVKGGMADAQARGPGSTSSQAQIGFTPYKAGDKSHETIKGPFVGSGTASAQSSGRIGQSQSQLQGTFKYGISYTGAAQAGSSLDKDAIFPNRLPFNKLNVFDEKNKNIDVNSEDLTTTELPPLPLVPVDEKVTEKDETLSNSKSKYSSHTHLDHHKTETPTTTPSTALSPVDNRRSFQPAFSNNGADYEFDKEDNAPDDYDPDNVDGEQGEYNYDDFPRDPDNTHQSLLSNKKALDIKQTNKGSTQHILLDSLNSHDAKIIQKTSDERKIYQPGEKVPGTNGYTIPIGFTGSIQAVSSKDKTYAVGSPHSPSQAQSVTLTPGTGKVSYVYPKSISDYSKNVNRHDLRSLNHKIDDSNKYLSVSKSVTGALDGDNNIKKQYSHTYYTKSSSCGYFTFTCTMVSGSNGRKKVCRPKVPTNPDGTPMRC